MPYGLKAHTRSVSWIVEQVVTQQAKYNAELLGLLDVDIDIPDTSLHDCIITDGNNSKYYVNVKIHNINNKINKNDIAAIEKLYMQYNLNPNYRIIYTVFGIYFQGVKVYFEKDRIHVFSPQFIPIYINPRNDKLQAYYYHQPVFRTRDEFLLELRNNSKSIVL